jgi:hypothetical protein
VGWHGNPATAARPGHNRTQRHNDPQGDRLKPTNIARRLLHIDIRAENGKISAGAEIQPGVELRKTRIDSGLAIRSIQLFHNRA